jgi:hypothetical protein
LGCQAGQSSVQRRLLLALRASHGLAHSDFPAAHQIDQGTSLGLLGDREDFFRGSTKLQEASGNYGVVRVAELDKARRWVVRYEPSWFLGSELGNVTPAQLVEYDSAGHEIARRPLPPTPVFEPSRAQALVGLVTPPIEAVLLTWATEHSFAFARQNGGKDVQPLLFFLMLPGQYANPLSVAGVAADRNTVLAYRGLILLSALACALTCFWVARRYSFSRTGRLGWSLCGLLFGPAGLLLMLALQEWPARIACPNCRKLRVVTREACEHCGAGHALPAPDGTEIFEENVALLQPVLAAR